jgi:hypothetical protein
MKKMLWVIIVALLVAFTPIIPYENEIQEGVTTIEHKSLFGFLKERYEKTQKGLGVVSPSVPKVQREDVVSDGKHVQ